MLVVSNGLIRLDSVGSRREVGPLGNGTLVQNRRTRPTLTLKKRTMTFLDVMSEEERVAIESAALLSMKMCNREILSTIGLDRK
jgi:hypothetical protein